VTYLLVPAKRPFVNCGLACSGRGGVCVWGGGGGYGLLRLRTYAQGKTEGVARWRRCPSFRDFEGPVFVNLGIIMNFGLCAAVAFF
jgi:hypothetical protein